MLLLNFLSCLIGNKLPGCFRSSLSSVPIFQKLPEKSTGRGIFRAGKRNSAMELPGYFHSVPAGSRERECKNGAARRNFCFVPKRKTQKFRLGAAIFALPFFELGLRPARNFCFPVPKLHGKRIRKGKSPCHSFRRLHGCQPDKKRNVYLPLLIRFPCSFPLKG